MENSSLNLIVPITQWNHYQLNHFLNNKQKSRLFQSAGLARFAYNWALGREQEYYKNGGNFLSDYDLRKELVLV